MNEYSVKFIDKLALLKILFDEVPLLINVKLHDLIEFLDSLH